MGRSKKDPYPTQGGNFLRPERSYQTCLEGLKNHLPVDGVTHH